jgi:hypothetical protein
MVQGAVRIREYERDGVCAPTRSANSIAQSAALTSKMNLTRAMPELAPGSGDSGPDSIPQLAGIPPCGFDGLAPVTSFQPRSWLLVPILELRKLLFYGAGDGVRTRVTSLGK